MTNPRDVFIQEFEPTIEKKQDKPGKFRAVLTNNLGATDAGSVWHDENARLVWFRAWASAAPAWALCDVIEPTLGLGVWIKFNDDIQLYEVIQDDPTQRSPDSDRSSYRAPTHEDFGKGGRFQLWLDPTLFIPISVYPIGADTVNVVSGDYLYQGERKTFAGEVNKDLSASRPAAGLHRLVGLYLDSSNALQTVNGSTIATGSDAPEPTWPDGAFRVAVVDIDNSTDISIDDIDNRKIIYTEDDDLSKGAWPPPSKVYRWDKSAGYVIIEDDLSTAVSNAASGDVIALGIGDYDLSTSQLSITTNLTIIGSQSDDRNIDFNTYIYGDVDNDGLFRISGGASVGLVNLYIENNGSTGGRGIDVEGGTLYLTNCQVWGDDGDGIYMNATTATTRLYMYGGNVECGADYAINLAVYSSALQAFIYHPANLDGVTGDINAVANSSVYLYKPILANNSIGGAGSFLGEFHSSNGVTYYVGDTTPADDQFPKWDNANSRWVPGYVDELWESDGGNLAWAVDSVGNLEDQLGRTTVAEWYDYPLFDTADDAGIASHFRDNDSSYPAGWTETDAAEVSRTDIVYSFWFLRGSSSETSWKYRIQTDINIESSTANYFQSFQFNPIFIRDGGYSADLHYRFGIYRDNAGIDENTYIRVDLYWNSASSVWQVRGEESDGAVTHTSSYINLSTIPTQPFVIRTMVRNDTNKLTRAYFGYLYISGSQTLLLAQNPTTPPTWGQVWLQAEMTRGAGIQDFLYWGGVDFLENVS